MKPVPPSFSGVGVDPTARMNRLSPGVTHNTNPYRPPSSGPSRSRHTRYSHSPPTEPPRRGRLTMHYMVRNVNCCLPPGSRGTRRGKGGSRTELAGNLIATRAIESAQLTLVDWKASGQPTLDHLIIVTNDAGSIANLRPYLAQPVSVVFRNVVDQLCYAPSLGRRSSTDGPRHVPAGSVRGRSLAKRFTAAPLPPNCVDTTSIVRAMSRKAAISA
jgi:hypothetical protein